MTLIGLPCPSIYAPIDSKRPPCFLGKCTMDRSGGNVPRYCHVDRQRMVSLLWAFSVRESRNPAHGDKGPRDESKRVVGFVKEFVENRIFWTLWCRILIYEFFLALFFLETGFHNIFLSFFLGGIFASSIRHFWMVKSSTDIHTPVN